MPVYEYRCSSCQTDFEQLLRSAADERKVVCPECGTRSVTRKLSVVATPRSDAGRTASATRPVGGCGRCGDPEGPCGL